MPGITAEWNQFPTGTDEPWAVPSLAEGDWVEESAGSGIDVNGVYVSTLSTNVVQVKPPATYVFKTFSLRAWNMAFIEKWVDETVLHADTVTIPASLPPRLKKLAHKLYDVVTTCRIEGVRQPEVDLDPEGGIDLVWANYSKRRRLLFTIDSEQAEGQDIEAMLIDGNDGYDTSNMDDNKIAKMFREYVS